MTRHACIDQIGEADETHLLQGRVVECWCPIGSDHPHADFDDGSER